MLDRESIYSAVLERLRLVPGIVTLSRRLQSMADTPTSQQPALFMAQTYQRPDYQEGRQVMWNLGAELYLYVRDPRNKTPGLLMNPLMDALMGVFQPDNHNKNACTLGGLVHHCRIGAIETDEGTMGEQAFALIPLDLRVAGSPL